MKLQIFSIFDSSVGAYKTPIYARNDKEVIRDLMRVMSEDNVLSQSPEDFTLFHLGSFSDDTATHTLYKTPTKVHTLLEIQSQMEQANEQKLNTPIQPST